MRPPRAAKVIATCRIVSPYTDQDIRAALNFYKDIQTRLYQRLANDFACLFERLGQSPRHFPIVLGDVRRAVLTRFPYALHFFIEPETVIVIAFLHTRRDPAIWPSRQ